MLSRRELRHGRRAVGRGALIGAAAAALLCASGASATFRSSASGGAMTVSSKRIFPGTRSTAAWTLRDASAGLTETNADDALSYADGTVVSTGNWSGSFASNRYLEFDFNGSRPAGVPVLSATFNFRMAANGAGETACFYLELYHASTGALFGTYGSSSSPVGCNSTILQTTYTQSLPAVTDTTTLDDLRIRVYGKESGGRAMKVDLATVTGSDAYASYTMYEKSYRGRAGGGATTTTSWAVATSGDGSDYTSAANWSNSFSSTRYLKHAFDAGAPGGAVITSVSISLNYRSSTAGDTACWYLEVYNGTTLIGSHGSSGAPVSCIVGNTTYATDTVSIPEVDTVMEVNNLVIRVYMKESGSRKTQIDLVQANVSYYLD
jgi:hypothetical protein